MIEREKAAVEFSIAHQQFEKAVKPAVRHFNDLAPSLFGRIAFEFTGFLPAPFDMSHITVRLHKAQGGCSGVTCISTQMLATPLHGLGPFHLDGLQYRDQLRDIMPVGPVNGERLGQHATLDALLALFCRVVDPSGWAFEAAAASPCAASLMYQLSFLLTNPMATSC